MKNKKRFSLLLAALLLIVSIVPAYAGTTADKLNEAEGQKKSTESTLQDTNSKISELEAKKGQSEAYLSDLNQQLTELKNSLEQLQKDSEEKQAELEQVQLDLEEAKVEVEKQYGDMKLRIQYMYENSNSGYIELLFSSESFGDFISKAQNMMEISKYDRNMLEDYQASKEQVEEKEDQVIAEQQEIVKLQAESAEKQEQVQALYEATYAQIREYSENIDSAQSKANDLLAQISAQDEAITQLMVLAKNEEVQREAEAKKAAEAAKAAEQKKPAQKAPGNNTGGSKPSSDVNDSTGNSSSNEESDKGSSTGGSSSSQGTYLGKFKLTSYCSCSKCCGQWSGGPTASGVMPTAGRTIAMAGVPFGTQLLINGNVYVVEDRGTQYGHIDVYCGSHSAALAFGVQYADVYRLN